MCTIVSPSVETKQMEVGDSPHSVLVGWIVWLKTGSGSEGIDFDEFVDYLFGVYSKACSGAVRENWFWIGGHLTVVAKLHGHGIPCL